MSGFNPGLNPTSDPDYERSASKGLDFVNVQGHNKEIDARRTAESLFAGVNAGIKGVDKSIQEGARSELEQGYERLNGAQGVDLAAANAVVNPGNTVSNPLGNSGGPPSTEQKYIAEGMERLTAARDQGKISNTHYYAQLESMVRNVKSRYPGYSEVIDRQIEGIAGVKPANALRMSMLHDFEKAEAAAQEKWSANQRFIQEHSQHVSPHVFSQWQKGEIDDKTMIADIQQNRAKVEDINAQTAVLARNAALNKLSEEEAKKGASDVVYSINQMAMDDVMTLAKHAEKERQSGTFDPVKYASFLEATRLSYRQKALEKVRDGVGTTLDMTEVNKILDDGGKVFDDYAQVFTKDGVGHLSALTQELEARKNQDLLRLEKDGTVGGTLRAIQAAKTFGGDSVAQIIASRVDRVVDLSTGIKKALDTDLTPAAKQVIHSQTTYMGMSEKVKGNPKAVFENLVKIGQDSPGSVREVLRLWKDNLTNAGLGDQWNKNSADALFGKENQNLLKEVFKDHESRKVAFGILTSPDVTDSLKKIGGETYENYKKWTYNNYLAVLKTSVNALQNVADRPYLDLKYDEKTGHLDLVPNKDGIELAQRKWYNESMTSGFARVLENFLGKGIHEEVRQLNEASDNVSKILEGDKYHPGEQIKNLLGALATSVPDGKTGLWSWVAKSIQLPDKKQLEDLDFGGTHPNFTQASGSNEEPRGLVSLLKEPTKAIDALKNSFAQGESGGNYNRLVDTPTHPKEVPLTGMPIKDVLAYQQGMLDAGNKSSAAGKYQIVSKTLRSLVKEGVVSPDDLYNERTQEKLADALLERRGLKSFLDGKISMDRFMRNLGEEWEIIKRSPAAYHKVMAELEKMKLASND